jgi:peptidoglycan/LPS O-acetylase OafA/YrhL
MYLWHWPLMRAMHETGQPELIQTSVSIALTFVIAAASFYVWERPWLNLKERFQRGSNRPAYPRVTPTQQ